MNAKEEILKALSSAATYLENSKQANDKKADGSFAKNVWHVGAELEYALFVFSITLQDRDNISRSKQNPDPKEDIASIIVKTAKMLKGAKKDVQDDKLLDAYRNINLARHYILKIQRDIAKKKREAQKSR